MSDEPERVDDALIDAALTRWIPYELRAELGRQVIAAAFHHGLRGHPMKLRPGSVMGASPQRTPLVDDGRNSGEERARSAMLGVSRRPHRWGPLIAGTRSCHCGATIDGSGKIRPGQTALPPGVCPDVPDDEW